MTIQLKKADQLSQKHIAELVDILNNDIKLIDRLGINKPMSDSEFVSKNKQWMSDNHAEIFAITLDNEAIGLISLSKIDHENQTARIGFWITSKYWNKGYTSAAFSKILSLSKKQNIKEAFCSIPKDNKESQAIWRKFGAKFEERQDVVIPSIRL